MRPRTIDYLAGYPEELRLRAAALRAEGVLEARLAERYPETHSIRSNGALSDYVQGLKRRCMRSSPPLNKVVYCDKIGTLHNALGTHTYAVRVQGSRLKRKNELRVGSLFKSLAPEFLTMVVVHELAHLRHRAHDRAFYGLCVHMEPEYHRYETDLRLLLYARDAPLDPGGP